MRYDCVIIGSGPAGISAAITARQRGKNILLVSNEEISSKIVKSPGITNFLGFVKINGIDFSDKILKQLQFQNINVQIAHVSAVYWMQSHFTITVSGSDQPIEAKTVILACGVSFDKPYKNEQKFVGMGVSYCATCDGQLYKDKNIIAIPSSQNDYEEIAFLAKICNHVIVVIEDSKLKPEFVDSNIEVLVGKITEIIGDVKAKGILLEENNIKADGIFIMRENVAPAYLVPGVEVFQDHITVNNNMETNIPGCFACGDIVGKPYQYIKAAGQGNIAALSAVSFLSKTN